MIADVQFNTVTVNTLTTRIASRGPESGPIILCLHGWPELWYSWRHQLEYFSARGFRVIAPDMPGFGGSQGWANTDDYHIMQLVDHVVAILDELQIPQVILLGHDWGAPIAWHAAQLYPARFSHLITMSVPLLKPFCLPPMAFYRPIFGENFFYQQYFQAPGVAEAEFDADPRGIISRLYCSPDTPRKPPLITNKHASAGGWIDRLGEPTEMPDWLSETDLDYIVGEFTRTGFAGGINYYRNIDRGNDLLQNIDHSVSMPTLFIAGEKDMVIQKRSAETLVKLMAPFVSDLQVEMIPEMGHWIQQEAPDRCNQLIENFLAAKGVIR